MEFRQPLFEKLSIFLAFSIQNFEFFKNAEPVELQLIVKDALDTGAEAYEATRGDKSVKMQAAMQAWQSSLDRARKAAAPDHWLSSKVEVPEHPSNGSEFPIQRIEKPK